MTQRRLTVTTVEGTCPASVHVPDGAGAWPAVIRYPDAGVSHTVETYAARHGFAVPDGGVYDKAADERHWAAMATLHAQTLPRSG